MKLAKRYAWPLAGLLLVLALPGLASAQRDKEDGPVAILNFLVLKDDNGKPVRSAAVIMHPVSNGKQERGGLELKTDADGKASFEEIPYGMLRVQVLAQGFQTFGEDYEINQAKMDFTIKLKRPQGQYSIYGGDAAKKDDKKDDKAPQ
ncbi:MAG: carboxypeptidase-like regulatory domain-containing protein [Candidatus Sulfotelmatobacter sp.]